MRLLTVGHSNHELERLIALLTTHQVTALADVRSRPRSGFSPQFNAEPLAASLRRQGIRYVPMGDQLGGQPEDRSLWREGRPDFAAMSQTSQLHQGLERLETGIARGERICLMCSEEDPAICHRHRLLYPLIAARGIEVMHIRGDGSLERPEVTETRVPARMRRQWQQSLL